MNKLMKICKSKVVCEIGQRKQKWTKKMGESWHGGSYWFSQVKPWFYSLNLVGSNLYTFNGATLSGLYVREKRLTKLNVKCNGFVT